MKIDERLERALRYLRTKQYPIREDDYECGYNDGLYEAISVIEAVLECESVENK